MSGDEDTELRDLIIHTLETNGIIGKIKAELRASIFLALEDDNFKNKIPLQRKELNVFTSSLEGKIVIGLIRDFLQHFCLDYSLAVFESEISFNKEHLPSYELCQLLGLEKNKVIECPLMASLISSMLSFQKKTEDWFYLSNDTRCDNKDGDIDEVKVESIREITNNESVEKIELNQQSIKDDPFFDDPFPIEENTSLFNNLSSVPKESTIFSSNNRSLSSQEDFGVEQLNNVRHQDGIIKRTSGSSLSCLQDLPSLIGSQCADQKALETLDKRLLEFGFDSTITEEEDYEDDNFHSSLSVHSEKSSQQSVNKEDEKKSKLDTQENSEQSIEEEIEEDLSAAADDMLVSSLSLGDDATSDQTISQASITGMYDYIENCN